MSKNNKFKIFLLDDIPDNLNMKTICKYQNAQFFLENYYKTIVINPIVFFQNEKLSRDEAYKNFFSALIDCDAVFLFNNNENLINNSFLLKLALHLDKIILYEPIDLTEDFKLNQNKVNKVFGR